MEITETTSTGTNTADPNSGLARLTEDFDTFLTILTTQLQNQDPLSPLDTHEFTNQLVLFAGVEQQVSQTDLMKEMIALENAGQTTGAVSYLGTKVETEGSTFALEDDGAELAYTLPTTASTAVIQIFDAQNTLVYMNNVPTSSGKHAVQWDGTDLNGNPVLPGTYTFTVSAVDGNDATLDIPLSSTGTVTGVSFADGETVLDIGGIQVPLNQVIAVREKNGTSS